ncbi:MAG: hypothetical protein ACOYL8_02990 [Patescibacteria group bacterium]
MRRVLSSPLISDLLAYVKVNDGLHFIDAGGPQVFKSIRFDIANRSLPIGIFLDLKIFDGSAAMENVLKKYVALFPPDILTVSSSCSVAGIVKLRKLLPNTKLAIVSVLADIGEDECYARFQMTPSEKITADLFGIRRVYFEYLGKDENLKPEPFDMIVCASKELRTLKGLFGEEYEFIVSERVAGVKEALENGANYVVMEPQLIKGGPEAKITSKQGCLMAREQIELFEVESGKVLKV